MLTTRPLGLDSGSQCTQLFALQKAVALRVSVRDLILSLFLTGVVQSPNHPGHYPNNLDKTETIQVESGKLLRMEFTHFDVQWGSDCHVDYVKITDGDGTTLMEKSCGSSSHDPSSSWYFLPPIITTTSNRVKIFFHTDFAYTNPGWSLSWSAVTPGMKTTIITLF